MNLDLEWVFERAYRRSSNILAYSGVLVARIIRMIAELPRVVFFQNKYSTNRIMGEDSKIACLVCTRNKARELDLVKLTLDGFRVYELNVTRKLKITDLTRIVRILLISFRSDLFSLVRVSEVYDYFILDKTELGLDGFYLYMAIDGVTPLNRAITSSFNMLEKPTACLVATSMGRHPGNGFTYNFSANDSVYDTSKGGFIRVASFQSEDGIEESSGKSIGLIGAPSPYRIFGVEYKTLLVILKLKKHGYTPVIRLHPQAMFFSAFLLNKLFGVPVNRDVDVLNYVNSISILLSTYTSSLMDLVISRGKCVVLDLDSDKKNLASAKQGMVAVISFSLIDSLVGTIKNLSSTEIFEKNKLPDVGNSKLESIYSIVLNKHA